MYPRTQGKTIVLPLASPQEYFQLLESSSRFRDWILSSFQKFPTLFPADFAGRFQFCGCYLSKKLNLYIRRIRLPESKQTYQIRPSCVMPYMIGLTQDIEKVLFLGMWGVPFWALTYCFGRDPMYWFRCFCSLGRANLVGATVKVEEALPENLTVDEKHIRWYREKSYIATTASRGCLLGASIQTSPSTEALTTGYQEFAQELKQIASTFQPKTVTTDGWEATVAAMKTLFPKTPSLLCFLHSWLSIRDRCRRDEEQKAQIGKRVWEAYKAPNKAIFSQRLRRLKEWALKTLKESTLKNKVWRLCRRRKNFASAYDFPTAKRTSNEVDRLMDFQDRQLYAMRGMKGTPASTRLTLKASCFLWNFHPYLKGLRQSKHPRSAFESCNGFVYEEGWLRNLLCASSLKGQRPLHKIR